MNRSTCTCLQCFKYVGCLVMLSLYLCGSFFPGWRIRELTTSRNATTSEFFCPRIGLWVAEICSRADCIHTFIPSMGSERLSEEMPSKWVPHLVLGTIGLLSSLITAWLIVVHAVRPKQSTRTSAVELMLYTFSCLSAICAIIPTADVLQENDKLQKENFEKLNFPYSLFMFGMGGIAMVFVACVCFVSNIKKELPIEALAFPFVDKSREQTQAAGIINSGHIQSGLNTENIRNNGHQRKLNFTMLLTIVLIFVANMLMLVSLATSSWLEVKVMHCEQAAQFGPLSSDLCDACTQVPECRDAIEFDTSFKVESLCSYVFNLVALVAAFFSRPTVRRIVRTGAVLAFYTLNLLSAVLTVNVVVHVLVIPKETPEHIVTFSYSLYAYGVTSAIAVITSATTITRLIRHCSYEIQHNPNAASNANMTVVNANTQENVYELALATIMPQREPEVEREFVSISHSVVPAAPPLIPSAPPAYSELFF